MTPLSGPVSQREGCHDDCVGGSLWCQSDDGNLKVSTAGAEVTDFNGN